MRDRPRRYRERRHRLPRHCYQGRVAVSYTVCVAGRAAVFSQAALVGPAQEMLAEALARRGCEAPVYCFMPDHVHVVAVGRRTDADAWAAITGFKQRVGLLLAEASSAHWQKDFYDRLLRWPGAVEAEIGYVRANPVRAGLVEDWRKYPFTGEVAWCGEPGAYLG